MLRTEACSGTIDDLAHVITTDMMADCLTKTSAKPDYLMKAVATGVLPNVDKHPPFRDLLMNKHKAYLSLARWVVHNLDRAHDIVTFLAIPIYEEIHAYLAGKL